MIKASGLHKSFGAVQAVREASLEVGTGEIVGLVGPDGAGKTTLLRMICGLTDADSGSIEIDGYPIARLDEIRSSFGYMPQRFSLYMDLTVMENILFFASLYGLEKKLILERGGALLERMGIAGFNDRLAGNLSGGMKQKLALTCSLINRPRLLVLDEPTYGVDPESRQEFWRILYDLHSQGLTILVSTPYMDEAELCTRVAVMNEGTVISAGVPGELRASLGSLLLELRISSKDPEAFRDCPEIQGFTYYGDRFHLEAADLARAERAVREHAALRGFEILSLRPVAATMEDVFVQMAGSRVKN